MAIELQEKGRVRFWAEVGKFTSNCQVEYVFNDNVIHEGKVRHIRTFELKWTLQTLFIKQSCITYMIMFCFFCLSNSSEVHNEL